MSRSDVEHGAELALVGAHVLENALVLHHVDVGHRNRARDRVAGEREPVDEAVLTLEERLRHAIGGDDGAHRRVGAGDPLRRGDQVGQVVVALGPEPVAEAPPRADDLVGDQQDVVLVADLAHALPVALGRGEAPAGVLHRLHDHGGHRVRALELDLVRHGLGQVGLADHPARQAERVRIGHVNAARHQGLERLAQGRDPGRRQGAQRRPVVGDLAGDDLRLVRVAGELVVLARELDRGLDRLAAAAGEEHAVQVTGREIGDARGQLDGGRVRVGPVGEELQVLGLVGARLGDVGPAVADVHAEESGQAVEVAVALLVPDVAALPADDDRDVVVGVGPQPT